METEVTEAARDELSPGTGPETEGSGPLVEGELLVEEISIDGMCGVY